MPRPLRCGRCPSASAWLRRPPASSTSAACARSSSTGSSRADRAGSACCGSRTPTRAARSRSRSSRSSARCAGSGSSGTARRRSSSTSWSGRRRRPAGSSRRAPRTRTRARSACACRTRASTGWDDAIKGRIEVPNAELEDVVLVRSDGRPTYNFASPLEDWLDGITHVIRGDDHVSNTPKQINVLRALGAEPPVYAHVPSVFGADGKKLSKRHGAVSVDEFRNAGYVSEALMNFLALLGWAPDGETTIMSRDELIERFSLERVGSSPATFDYAKLDWMNGVYLRALPAERVRRSARRLPARTGRRLARGPRAGGGADRPGEDRAARRVRRLRGLPLPRRRAGSRAARRADPRRRRDRARRRRAVGGGRDRSRAQEALRRSGGEAADRVPADPRRGDRARACPRGCTRASSCSARRLSLARIRAGLEAIS